MPRYDSEPVTTLHRLTAAAESAHPGQTASIFSARQHKICLARYMLSSVRPLSVHLSVCPSYGWIIEKRLKLGL